MSSHDKLIHLVQKCESNSIYIDFILICETFLNSNDDKATLNGYGLVSRSRVNKSKGGVAIYVNNKYQFKIRDDLAIFVEGEFETIFLEILSSPCNAIVGEIYRVPNTPANESVIRYESIISKLLSHKSLDSIIGTDQNFDYLKINEHQHTSNLFDTYISNGLIPVMTRPTRIIHQTASLIDNIYIKLPNETQT